MVYVVHGYRICRPLKTEARLTQRLLSTALGVLLVALFATDANADEKLDMSPESFALQFGVGMYQPDNSEAFDNFFSGDNGPILELEFDFFVYRIPYVGPIGFGVRAAWAKYEGTATTVSGSVISNEKTKLQIFPLSAMAVLRIDALARHTPVPIVFAGKVGIDSILFFEKTGSVRSGEGRTHGFRWAVQAGLELNAISPRRANALDEDWGINSSFLYFELSGSDANSKISLGDKLGWTAGLGLTF